MQTNGFDNWKRPLLVAGPCSAESEEQVLETARLLKEHTPAAVFRAGIWKPRTRPGSFEGVGEKGLPWLQRVKAETGLLTAIEVANAAHVEQALATDVDILWIGARSTVSPFIVQEIADALAGTDKKVWVKNPVSPDLSLWLGAVERLDKAGLQQLGLIHRGFSAYIKTRYRNNPEWQIAIDMRAQLPGLPMLLDPSHMGGSRELILPLCQAALEMDYDGLMVETHPAPDHARSDAAQQITPQHLGEIVQQLQRQSIGRDKKTYVPELNRLRLQIDNLDAQLMTTLGKRLNVATAIGQLKKENQVPILQSERWKAVLEQMLRTGEEAGLSAHFVNEVFKAIHQASIERQQDIKRG